MYEHGFSLSGIPLGGDQYIVSKLQSNLDKTKEVIADICKLKNVQEKLVLLLKCIPGRIQHLLAAVPINLSRDFARQHDEAISKTVADTLDLGDLNKRDKLLMQRKTSGHGLGLRSMEKNLEFLFVSGFMRSIKTIKNTFPISTKPCSTQLKVNQALGVNLRMLYQYYINSLAENCDCSCLTPLDMHCWKTLNGTTMTYNVNWIIW